jgi:hypothetical protein
MTNRSGAHLRSEQPPRSLATLGFHGALGLLVAVGTFGLVFAIVNPGA